MNFEKFSPIGIVSRELSSLSPDIIRIHLYKCHQSSILISSTIFKYETLITCNKKKNKKKKEKNMHRYRFKHALDDVNLCDEKYNDALMHEAYAKVCRSIEAHKRAVELVSLHNA